VLWEIVRERAACAAISNEEEVGPTRRDGSSEIAGTIEDERLRATFLARPEVQAVTAAQV
jgi:hypothetical protein